jgi:Zn ribbon nucleic-acid-binding protein
VNWIAAMNQPACQHKRTQTIAEDKDAKYVECLDCGAILESAELEKVEKKDTPGFNESLSDA